MKVVKIEAVAEGVGIFEVTLEPNLTERVFGCKKKVIKIKNMDFYYICGGGSVYIMQDGSKLGNGHYIGEAVDKWRIRF